MPLRSVWCLSHLLDVLTDMDLSIAIAQFRYKNPHIQYPWRLEKYVVLLEGTFVFPLLFSFMLSI